MGSLTFEFELISNSDDVVIAADGTTSSSWQIENPMIQADLCTIDNIYRTDLILICFRGRTLAFRINRLSHQPKLR